ncbi:MAG: class I adenylate-forming enzyme family protein [Gammaproteobacteria bacterium]
MTHAPLTPAEVLARYPAHDDSLPGLLAGRVARGPTAPAIEFNTRRWDYAALDIASGHAAALLAGLGVRAGEPVAVCAANSDLHVLLFLACAKLGAIFAPMNIALTDTELGYVVGHTRPRVIFTRAAAQARLARLAEEPSVPVVALETLGFDANSPAEVLSAIREAGGEVNTPPAAAAESALVVVYTSGTTGFPKGVVHTQRNYVWAAEAFVERMHLQPDERLLTVLPFFHINALFYSLGGALAAGACLVIAESFSASRFWEVVHASGATQFNTLAAVGSILCKRSREEFRPGHVLRKVYGGPISAEVAEVFPKEFGVPDLVEGYGMSEIPGACNNPYTGPHKLGSIGLPARHPRLGRFVDMRVVDDAGREVGDDVVGELEVRTPIVFREYLHDPVQTAAAFHDGWFVTGDLVRRDRDGYYHFVARKKDIIRVRGENVAGAELDRILGGHPAVAEAATIGVPAELGDEEILAVLVARAERPAFGELAAWCRRELAAIKVPRYWVWADSLPHTPTARVAKHLLKKDAALIARRVDLRT